MCLLSSISPFLLDMSAVKWPVPEAATSSAETHPQGPRMFSISTANNSNSNSNSNSSSNSSSSTSSSYTKADSTSAIEHQIANTSSCNTSRLCISRLISKRVSHLLWDFVQSARKQQLSHLKDLRVEGMEKDKGGKRGDKKKRDMTDEGKQDKEEREVQEGGEQVWLGREGKAESDLPFSNLELLLPSARAAGIYFVSRPEGADEGVEQGGDEEHHEEEEEDEEKEEEEREDEEAWSQLRHDAAAMAERTLQQHNRHQGNLQQEHQPPTLPHSRPPQSRSPRRRLSLLKDVASEDGNPEVSQGPHHWQHRRHLIMSWLKDAWVRSVAFRLNGDPREDRFLVGSQEDQGYQWQWTDGTVGSSWRSPFVHNLSVDMDVSAQLVSGYGLHNLSVDMDVSASHGKCMAWYGASYPEVSLSRGPFPGGQPGGPALPVALDGRERVYVSQVNSLPPSPFPHYQALASCAKVLPPEVFDQPTPILTPTPVTGEHLTALSTPLFDPQPLPAYANEGVRGREEQEGQGGQGEPGEHYAQQQSSAEAALAAVAASMHPHASHSSSASSDDQQQQGQQDQPQQQQQERYLVWFPRFGLGNSLRGFCSAYVYALLSGRRLLRWHGGKHRAVLDHLCTTFDCSGVAPLVNFTDDIRHISEPLELHAPRQEFLSALHSGLPVVHVNTGSFFDNFWHKNGRLAPCVQRTFHCHNIWCVRSHAIHALLGHGPVSELQEVIEEIVRRRRWGEGAGSEGGGRGKGGMRENEGGRGKRRGEEGEGVGRGVEERMELGGEEEGGVEEGRSVGKERGKEGGAEGGRWGGGGGARRRLVGRRVGVEEVGTPHSGLLGGGGGGEKEQSNAGVVLAGRERGNDEPAAEAERGGEEKGEVQRIVGRETATAAIATATTTTATTATATAAVEVAGAGAAVTDASNRTSTPAPIISAPGSSAPSKIRQLEEYAAEGSYAEQGGGAAAASSVDSESAYREDGGESEQVGGARVKKGTGLRLQFDVAIQIRTATKECEQEQQQLRAAEAAHMQQFLTPDKWACITRLLLFLRTRKSGIKLPNPSKNNPDPLVSLLQSLSDRAGQGLVKEEGRRGSKKSHGAGDIGDGLEGIESGALSSLKPLSVFLATDNENLRPQFVDKIGPVAGDVFFSTGAVTHTSKSGAAAPAAAAAAAASAAAGGRAVGAGGAGGLEGRSEGEGGVEGSEGDERQKAAFEEHFQQQPSPTMAEFFLLSRARVLVSFNKYVSTFAMFASMLGNGTLLALQTRPPTTSPVGGCHFQVEHLGGEGGGKTTTSGR
ncbi:unnamed protein product [Closterium sp. NIES-53]